MYKITCLLVQPIFIFIIIIVFIIIIIIIIVFIIFFLIIISYSYLFSFNTCLYSFLLIHCFISYSFPSFAKKSFFLLNNYFC